MTHPPELRTPPEPQNSEPSQAPGVSPMPGPRGDAIEGSHGEPFTGAQLMYLLGFTLLAAALRLWDLGTWPLWVDEAHTFREVVMSDEAFWASKTSRYPLSYLLLRWIVDLFALVPADLSEGVLRLPFAFFGIASVPTLAVVARGLVGRQAALLAAAFLVFSPWHIFWSQNARFYSMVLFFCLCAIGTFYSGIQRRSWPRITLAVSLFFVAGFCHLTAYFVFGAALIYFLFATVAARQRSAGGSAARWAPLVVMGLLAVLVWLALPVLQRQLAGAAKPPVFSLVHLIQTLVFYMGVPVLVAAGGGMLCLFDKVERSASFLTCIVILPLLGLSVLAAIPSQTITAQYAFAVLPPVYMLAAVLVVSLAGVFKGKGLRPTVLRLVPATMVICHMLGQDFLYFHKAYGWRPRWQEAVSYVDRHARENGDKTLLVLTTNRPSVSYYFDPVHFEKGALLTDRVEVRPLETGALGDTPDAVLQSVVDRVRKENKDLWVIVTEPELHEVDRFARVDLFFRKWFRQVRRLPNWLGPKDMCVLIYHLEDVRENR